ncbi:uncharacterized protein METZ01_LOCUS151891 [marine metagenome]|uniref:Uncharacterized protein n=1 Tax=marine metagenome TaxID=408172 RepID=A0A382ADH0_9ZZZZ
MKTTVYAWGAEKNNVLHIYAGMTTQKDLGIRLNGVKDIMVGAADSWFGGPEDSSLGAYNLDLIYADSTQNYSRHKEQRAINAVWAVEQKYRNASLPVRSLNSNRAVGLGSVQKYLDRTNSVYGHVLLHDTELDSNFNNGVFQAIESWIKEKIQDSTTLKRKFETALIAKQQKQALIANITKVLGLEPVLA